VQQLATPIDNFASDHSNNRNNSDPYYKKYMPEKDTMQNPEGIKKLNK